ncbi:L-2-amino-thiazoline-4-carboxylic acid hydrolase [Bradyrhizobium diversitatis]|uniref:L-2-amino-thiazoline-4-carboxylic acid hydrolase n=1 Tax=Bradyrhizobium diversitatis TaxID=2755406 RepID=A0ABS0P0L0_9BRAD|nr:L-2-amino-thiazoline-4-carboxylic acid hydrolase [Bradyrhizobium diversitatis]MBH5386796.1 L-2-amino-thiazoline-4-carboxylic acid hydrolase [Bradyrhizobium diversitatis]
MTVSVIEQAKIQAQVLVPLVKALQAEIGEAELGFLLICTADFATAEGFGPDIKLTRTQTIMQGASHCDFRYKRDAGGSR